MVTVLVMLGCSSPATERLQRSRRVSIPSDAMTALQNGIEFQLFSLEPSKRVEGDVDGFHDLFVLGATAPSQADRDQLVESLAQSVIEHDGSIAACFDPRHGIRVHHNGKVFDFIICFECAQIYWFKDKEKNPTILTSGSAQPVFDKVLKAASIKLADPA